MNTAIKMRRLTCSCGHIMHLTPGVRLGRAGEPLKCPDCGHTARIPVATPVDIVRNQASLRPRRKVPSAELPASSASLGFVAVMVAISLGIVKLGGLLLLLVFGHFGIVLLVIGVLLMLMSGGASNDRRRTVAMRRD